MVHLAVSWWTKRKFTYTKLLTGSFQTIWLLFFCDHRKIASGNIPEKSEKWIREPYTLGTTCVKLSPSQVTHCSSPGLVRPVLWRSWIWFLLGTMVRKKPIRLNSNIPRRNSIRQVPNISRSIEYNETAFYVRYFKLINSEYRCRDIKRFHCCDMREQLALHIFP